MSKSGFLRYCLDLRLAQSSDFCIPQKGVYLGLEKFSHDVVVHLVAARHVALIALGMTKTLKQ